MQLLGLIARRSAWVIPVALGVATLTFFFARIFGGDPIGQYLPLEASDDALRDAIAARYGLDLPLWQQYLNFLAGVFTFDLGESMSTGQPVLNDILSRLPATLELAIFGLTFGTIFGIVIGVIAAVRPDGIVDWFARGIVIGGMAMPSFVTGLILMLVFAVTLGVLPGPVGRRSVGSEPPPQVTGFYVVDSLLAGNMDMFWDSLAHLALPIATLTIGVMAPVARVVRSAMVESLQSEYVRTSVAMGHGQTRVWFDHALRNALLPTVTLLAEAFSFTFGGAILVESIFGWPGIGQYTLQVTLASDFPSLQGVVLYAAFLTVLAYLIADVLYMLIDPRTRTAVRV
ncbi:ABC transporter permease [Microbacterium sp. 18062]|uniref:ABC transporter permease n=1 Tax=Microbacterium sp. 18062 TaxID=2681410 RepID=UPI00135A8315|nr:ABC transporter permease [Microbacterium sp. 18062]